MASASEGSLPQTVFDLEASGMIKSWKSIREAVHLSELAMASLAPDGKDFDMQARVKAASALGEETVFEILDDIEVFDTVNRAVSGNGGVALDIASICDQVCQPQGQSSPPKPRGVPWMKISPPGSTPRARASATSLRSG